MLPDKRHSPKDILHVLRAMLLQEDTVRYCKDERDLLPDDCRLESISADGSTRNFIRVMADGRPFGIIVYPSEKTEESLAEAKSCALLGRHLFSKDIPVPEIYAFNEQNGLILYEDCGDHRVHDVFSSWRRYDESELLQLYSEIAKKLCHMYVQGSKGLDETWCYDSPRYDHEVMIESEGKYFYNVFWLGLCEGVLYPDVLAEFEDIARQAACGLPHGFLHRDFQSRNIMIQKGRIRFIDFQAGRLGPPGYDLASLLIDPYMELDETYKERLVSIYVDELKTYLTFDEGLFYRQYAFLTLQRNMQILGAFAFLLQKKQKKFFASYIQPALASLEQLLADKHFSHYTTLRKICTEASACLR